MSITVFLVNIPASNVNKPGYSVLSEYLADDSFSIVNDNKEALKVEGGLQNVG